MTRKHETHHVDLIHLVFYGMIVSAVVVVGVVAIWFFLERQSLVIRPEPLPKVTLVTRDADSNLAASWVRLLTRAGLNPTLVAVDDVERVEGVIVLCDVTEIPPRLHALLQKAPAVVFAGAPPQTSIGGLELVADEGLSDRRLRLSDMPSPVLARIRPGHTLLGRVTDVAQLRETPQMIIDGRWADNARAAIMHMEVGGSRYVWFGLDPRALVQDNELMLILRTAFRWASGQPVSEGAVGSPQTAGTLAAVARQQARSNNFTVNVERSSRPNVLIVRMTNRAGTSVPNPTVKVWLPLGVKKVALGGDFIMRRNATLTGAPEEGACLLSLPTLARNETRVLKLEIVER